MLFISLAVIVYQEIAAKLLMPCWWADMFKKDSEASWKREEVE